MSVDALDRDLVRYIAGVARLKLSEEEVQKYSRQLKVIIGAFRELDEVDVDDVAPSFHPVELSGVLREDTVRKWRWDPLSNAEHREKNYFRGPKIT